MDGNISKALWLGVTILLFVAVVTIGITLFNGMKDIGDEADDRIGAIAGSLADEAFRAYDGKTVKGDDVLTAISTFAGQSGELIVLVDTLGDGTATTLNPESGSLTLTAFAQYVSSTSRSIGTDDRCYVLSEGNGSMFTTQSKKLQDAARRDAENSNLPGRYINPAGRFASQLLYDTNQKICGAIFAQVE